MPSGNRCRDDYKLNDRLLYRSVFEPSGLDPVLMKGPHSWPFRLSIPEKVPGSWSGAAHSFSISHNIRVVVTQRKMFASDFEGTLAVRVLRAPVTYRFQEPRRVTAKLEKSFWRDGGRMEADFRIVESVMLSDEVLTVMGEIDLTQAKVDIRMIQLRLYQNVCVDGEITGIWRDDPVSVSPLTKTSADLKAGQKHSCILVLPIPAFLYTMPTMQSARLQCDYKVAIFISPDTGPDLKDTFYMPLESGLDKNRPVYSASITSVDIPDDSLPPAYNPKHSQPVILPPPSYQKF